MYKEQVSPGYWFDMETASGRKVSLAAVRGNKIYKFRVNLLSFMLSFILSVGFPLIRWIYVLWRPALTKPLLFFLLSSPCERVALRHAAIIISRAAHKPTPFAPRRVLRQRSEIPVIFYYVTCGIFFFSKVPQRCSARLNNRNSLLFPYKIKSHQREAFNPVTRRWLADLIFSRCDLRGGGDVLPKGGGREKRALCALSLQPLMKLS